MALVRFNFRSDVLRRATTVNILLPTNFSKRDTPDGIVDGVKYQVLWLLHGGAGDENDFLNFSRILRYADEHRIAVVMPSAQGNFFDEPYFELVTRELPELLSIMFPLSRAREDNFIGGLSHGGSAALRAALELPEKYAAALVMSAAGVEHVGEFTPLFDLYGDAERCLKSGSPLTEIIFATGAGTNKSWSAYSMVISKLTDMGLNITPYIIEGHSHNWSFWDETVGYALRELLPIRHDFIRPEKQQEK